MTAVGARYESDMVSVEVAEGPYRYRLAHRWGVGPSLLWIMLNPSSATAQQSDPTMRRVIGFTHAAGHHACVVVNLFAWRSPSPKALAAAIARREDVRGPRNDEVVSHCIRDHQHRGAIVAAWGDTSARPWAYTKAREILRDTDGWPLLCLGLTKNGSPRHPLYVPARVRLEPWSLRRI